MILKNYETKGKVMERQGKFQPHQQIDGLPDKRKPAVFRQGKFQPHQQILKVDKASGTIPVKKVEPVKEVVEEPMVEDIIEDVDIIVGLEDQEAVVEKKTAKTSKKN